MSHDYDRLTERVREIMAETFDVDAADIPAHASQQNYSPWNSLAQLTLTVALEEAFGLSFSITEMNQMGSLAQIVDLLRKHGVESRV